MTDAEIIKTLAERVLGWKELALALKEELSAHKKSGLKSHRTDKAITRLKELGVWPEKGEE